MTALIVALVALLVIAGGYLWHEGDRVIEQARDECLPLDLDVDRVLALGPWPMPIVAGCTCTDCVYAANLPRWLPGGIVEDLPPRVDTPFARRADRDHVTRCYKAGGWE